MTKNLNQFLIDLRAHESSTDYTVVNDDGYMGWYQFGEEALVQVGWIEADGNDQDNNRESYVWTTKSGISSTEEFLQDPDIQNRAMMDWIKEVWHQIRNLKNGPSDPIVGREFYAEQTLNDHLLTVSGMIVAADRKSVV